MTPVPLSPSKMGTETICEPVTAAWLLAMAGRFKNTSTSVVWGDETGVEDSDEGLLSVAFFSRGLFISVEQVSSKLQRNWDGQVRDMTRHRIT